MYLTPHYALAIISALSINLQLASCSRCPKDEKLGTLELQETSQTWLSYQGGETLVFINEAGEELAFTLPSDDNWKDKTRLVVDIPCSEGSFLFPEDQEVYYDRASYQLYPASGAGQRYSFIYHLRVYQAEDLPGQDTLLVDYLEASAQFDTHVANLFTITDSRDNTDVTADIINSLSNVRHIGDTSLTEKSFQNVYTNLRTSGSETYVYFSPEQGFVGVSTPTENWILDRIE